MEINKRKITLGFTSQEFEQGAHICQIYSNEDERQDALVNFIISGLKDNEKCACFTENETSESLNAFFRDRGVDYDFSVREKGFSLMKTGEIYFKDNDFDPDRMLDLLKEFYEESVSEKRPGARAIGEMTPSIEKMPGRSRLLEYESKVTLLVEKYPITAVCQYDAREFDGSTIMDVLKVHPYMIVRGSVVHNPFFVDPETYLLGYAK